MKLPGTWQSTSQIESRGYLCGHCGEKINTNVGYFSAVPGTAQRPGYSYICHNCNNPTFFDPNGSQYPGQRMGNDVPNLPDDIEKLYKEIRDATAINAYTSAILAARKLLMHIAVECGASPGKKFVSYVDYLVDNHYTPPNSKTWVDKIRSFGNEATHEIVIMTQPQAADIIKFIEMILRFNYEFQMNDSQ
jgi:hypothetical protein